jgi:hypothetical protein
MTRSATPLVGVALWRPRALGRGISGRSADEALLGQPIDQRRDIDAAEPNDRSPPLGDHDLLARPGALEPLLELTPELRDSYLCHHRLLYLRASVRIHVVQSANRDSLSPASRGTVPVDEP